jgi:arylsulfatase
MEFQYAGGGRGKGGKAILYIEGDRVGEIDVPRTHMTVFSADDGLDVGQDGGAPVSPEYGAQGNAFNGTVLGVQLSIEEQEETEDHKVDPETAIRMAMARQ